MYHTALGLIFVARHLLTLVVTSNKGLTRLLSKTVLIVKAARENVRAQKSIKKTTYRKLYD